MMKHVILGALSVLTLCGFNSVMAAPNDGTTLTLNYAIPNYAVTVDDDSNVTVSGKIFIVEKRDSPRGPINKFALLHSDTAYGIRPGVDVDDSNISPTRDIMLDGSVAQLRRYLGYTVTIKGRISATNGGGPMIMGASISN